MRSGARSAARPASHGTGRDGRPLSVRKPDGIDFVEKCQISSFRQKPAPICSVLVLIYHHWSISSAMNATSAPTSGSCITGTLRPYSLCAMRWPSGMSREAGDKHWRAKRSQSPSRSMAQASNLNWRASLLTVHRKISFAGLLTRLFKTWPRSRDCLLARYTLSVKRLLPT